ncbi:response regulator transcription factor [Luteolibacter arcticus]|uniref:Response regulator transcription factor n=1 Tax=Luteolibacter arcticus TaxID=1581411 RepID=A0ABT3GEA7_9BACT|nr:response regulator transcription factor [Luteolibacter arcticus]MCW1921354.1 response regulator transcription factor [Luteolibacter arcticus]
MKITVSIVDDDDRLRLRLQRLLGRSEDCECISDHATGQDAVERLPGLRPQVVLMDINLPGLDGIGCVQRLKPQMPGTEFIMLTVYEDSERIFQALAAGASGYLLKQAEFGEIHDAILQVQQGGAPMSSHIARKVVTAFRPKSASAPGNFQDLTARESEILDLLSKGLLYKEIAEQLKVSYNTVNNHVRHIYEKLHVNTRTEAVAIYFESRSLPERPG